ncbi:MAG: VOC family protein [Phycisphaerales bacterium]
MAEKPGVCGGGPTVYVSDLAKAIEFYEQTLGLSLLYQGGGEFAMIDAGGGMHVGLHIASEHSPKPGSSGSIQVGFTVSRSIDEVVQELKRRGVRFRGDIVDDGPVRTVYFDDPDGNDLYLCEFGG